MAKLSFRYGAMNSGKSTILLQVAHNYQERGMRAVVLKPFIDTKAGNKISSRIGIEKRVDALIDKNHNIIEIFNRLVESGKITAVLVDECQFFQPVQIDQLRYIASILNIPVICFGLRSDFQTNAFPGSLRLFEIADDFEEMRTICRCGKKATFNLRKIDGKSVFEGDQVVIDDGSLVEYESVCPKCYLEFKESTK